MTARAGIVVTGTEVLSGIIADRNGPWLSERLRSRGVDLAHVMIVGDRRADLRAALDFLAGEGMDLVITSGGLGPTADDLTGEVVADFAGRELVLDEALEGRIAAILERMRARWRVVERPDAARRGQAAGPDARRSNPLEDAMRAGNRKQAMVPAGAAVLEPVGTAPGLVVPGSPVVVVLPGPPGELQRMWEAAIETEPVRAVLEAAGTLEQRIMRLFGPPESEIAQTLRDAEAAGVPLDRLEITTCLRRGEIEIATVFDPSARSDYDAFEAVVAAEYGERLFARDGETIDDLVVARLLGPPVRTVATAESCTGGLMAARLTNRGGSSAYALGGITAYSNEAKMTLAGVPASLIEAHGAVSPEVASALADGAISAFEAGVGIGITGIAGPGGGTPEKPVGTVCLCLAAAGGERIERTVRLPGDRAMVRERTTTAAMHLLLRLLA